MYRYSETAPQRRVRPEEVAEKRERMLKQQVDQAVSSHPFLPQRFVYQVGRSCCEGPI